MNFGCIGEKLGHSFSREIHRRFADYPYELKEIPPEELDAFMRQRDFEGINVTIPYKQAVLPYLSGVSPLAERIGAVNTVLCKANQLYGYNTDYDGLRALIERMHVSLKGRKVLILGTGGTSRTALAVAEDLGAKTIIKVSRGSTRGISYEEAKVKHRDAEVLINTTPCGMFPQSDAAPVSAVDFPQLAAVVDVIYNPLRSKLVLQAQQKGIPATGGLFMLVAQAAAAVSLFLNEPVPAEKTERVYRELLFEKENIVLTGMPGSGKSTVGAALSQALRRPLLDTDCLITDITGRNPADWISAEGESAFRSVEAQVIAEAVSARNGCVIATGGGAILRPENIEALKRNGTLCFLNRPISQITDYTGRPLSADPDMLLCRWQEREPVYRATADHIIATGSTPEETCNRIIKELKR